MERREFNKGLLATIASFALIDSLFAYNAIRNNIEIILNLLPTIGRLN